MKISVLNKDDIKMIIPHRDPLLLIDSVAELEPGKRITAIFYVDPARDIFAGHFPGNPVLPGIYTVEMMAQAADIMMLSTNKYKGKTPYFLGIDNVRFKSKILPGDQVAIHASIRSEIEEKGIIACEAEVFNGAEQACTGIVTLAMR